MNRRKFLLTTGIVSLALDTSIYGDDCGPPISAKPQHQTGGESFAPLPLPVTPMRRSEKKRPPSPPTLVGKVILGKQYWVTIDNKRVLKQDWKTDPADIDTLLKWCKDKIGINYKYSEVDLNKFSYDPKEIPCLYFTGHDNFSLNKEQKSLLHKYILNGGFIIGDACCGSKDFIASFLKEIQEIVGELIELRIDSPIYNSYYKIDNKHLFGIDIGCRTAVIFSSKDMSCGWDGHTHLTGERFAIDEARQIGANLITYILGDFQLGTDYVKKVVYYENSIPTRDRFEFAQLVYNGQWNPDHDGLFNLLKYAKDNSTLEVKFGRCNIVLDNKTILYNNGQNPNDAPIVNLKHPLIYMTGHRKFIFTEQEVKVLQSYIRGGGLLLVDACCGSQEFKISFFNEVKKLTSQPSQIINTNHPIYNIHFNINDIEDKFTPRVYNDFGRISHYAIHQWSYNGKLAIIFSEMDIGCGWEKIKHPYSYGYNVETAMKLGTNIIIYAIIH